jgi:hypothetical protein
MDRRDTDVSVAVRYQKAYLDDMNKRIPKEEKELGVPKPVHLRIAMLRASGEVLSPALRTMAATMMAAHSSRRLDLPHGHIHTHPLSQML